MVRMSRVHVPVILVEGCFGMLLVSPTFTTGAICDIQVRCAEMAVVCSIFRDV